MSSSSTILYNSENYCSEFTTYETRFYFDKYVNLLNQYLLHINDNIYVQDREYQLFIIKRGIDTLSHIFTTLLMYTKNIDLTYHHVEKSYCYYVEFISQISDENHSFLKLNSKDAALFVYKKTVFDINQDYRKNFTQSLEEENMLRLLHSNIKEYNQVINNLLYNNDLYDDNQKTISDTNITEAIYMIIKSTKSVSEYIYDLTKDEDVIKTLFQLISIISYYLYKYGLSNAKIIGVCQTAVKKFVGSSTSFDTIYQKLISEDFKELLDFTPIKIVNWLFDN